MSTAAFAAGKGDKVTVLRRLYRFGPVIACAAAALAIAAPLAQADSWGAHGLQIALITEHSLGQNGTASSALRCGQLDPWAYRLVCGASSGTRVASLPTSHASSDSQVVRSAGFDWRDASIGAATTLGLLLLLGVAGTFAFRRRRTVAHVSS
jgi:hypothetical protein